MSTSPPLPSVSSPPTGRSLPGTGACPEQPPRPEQSPDLGLSRPSTPTSPGGRWTERLRDLFRSDHTKVVLSVLILLSVLPFPWTRRYSLVFFSIFLVELGLRSFLFVQDFRQRRSSWVELPLLVFDLLATASFLPLEMVWGHAGLLRLFRLSRMLLLLTYWAPLVREVWYVLGKRERRYQLSFVGVSVVILSFGAALLLEHFQVQGIDFNGDGVAGNDSSFWSVLWWSFCQLQSADNILKDPEVSLVFLFSILLTGTGLVLFSFLIGIGNSVVEELVTLSKERRLGLSRHTVICNVGTHSESLLQELVAYYLKSFRSPRIITLGSAPRRFDYMHEPQLLGIRYRQGQAMNHHDLQKVDADRASRIILLGRPEREVSDSEVISQLLSVREIQDGPIYAELFHSRNVPVALRAGRDRTVPIQADLLASHFLAGILAFPDLEEVYAELLTSVGEEIYTCVYGQGALTGELPPRDGQLPEVPELIEWAYRQHGVLLLGTLHRDARSPAGFSQRFFSSAGRPGAALRGSRVQGAGETAGPLTGFFGIADSFERLRKLGRSLDSWSRSQRKVSSGVPRGGPSPAPAIRVDPCPARPRLERVLICGFHEGILDLCEELIRLARPPEIVLMLPPEREPGPVLDSFLERSAETAGSGLPHQRVTFTSTAEERAAGRVRYAPADPEPLPEECRATPDGNAPGESPGRVPGERPGGAASLSSGAPGTLHVTRGDASDERVLRGGHPAHRLSEVDAVLLTYDPQAVDPDARTSLALLKLLQLMESEPDSLRPDLRICCELLQPEKAALFRRRLPELAAGSARSVSIVSAEGRRSSLLAQAIFVPGILGIYQELLARNGTALRRLPVRQVCPPGTLLTFADLLSTFWRQDGLLAVGVELVHTEGRRRVLLNPAAESPEAQFPAEQLSAVLVVGPPPG